MLATGLKYFTETSMVAFALLLFLGAFFAIIWRTYFRASAPQLYTEVANLPLQEDYHE